MTRVDRTKRSRRADAAPKVRLRPAKPADVRAIVHTEQPSFTNPKEAFNRRQIASLVRNPHAIVTVGTCDGRVLGWVVGLIRRHPRYCTGRIYAIAVHPEARGLRLGRRLLEHALKALRRCGVETVFLEARIDNERAIELYRKVGFAHRHHLPHYYGRGRHGLSMVRRKPG